MNDTVIFGAYFSKEDIESVFTKIDVASKIFEGDELSPIYELSGRLEKFDQRFRCYEINYDKQDIEIIAYGIPLSELKDYEVWGKFKRHVKWCLSRAFKKEINCSILTINNEDY